MPTIYPVTIRGRKYRTTVTDPLTPVYLALLNLNNPKVDAVLKTLQVHISLDGQLIPYDRPTHPVISRLSRFLRRVADKTKAIAGVKNPGPKTQAQTSGSGHQTQDRRGRAKGKGEEVLR